MGDKPGDVELVGWGAEVQNGILYAAFELDPNGPTVAQYDDFQTSDYGTGHYLWASLWIDVDPGASPATGITQGDSQFSPRVQDIYVELGTDQGGLLPTDPVVWNSLNLWGHNNNFSNLVPVTVNAAYQGHVLEFAVPVSDIIAELPNTDNATPASVWAIGARVAGHGFGGGWDGDITALQSVRVSGIQGKITLQGYLGDYTTMGVKFQFTPVGGGATITRTVLLGADGSFGLDGVPAGTYNMTAKSGISVRTVFSGVSVSSGLTDLGTINLKNADINGDAQVSFEDFSILQNSYGQSGAAGANPLCRGGPDRHVRRVRSGRDRAPDLPGPGRRRPGPAE